MPPIARDELASIGSTLEEPGDVPGTTVRIAAIGDLHCTRTSQGAFQPLLAKVAESAELLLLAGDLTDYGLPDEARVLARELTSLRIPVAAVLGNHDFESCKEHEVRQILADAGVVVLDGDATEMHGIGIAGIKGFGGGFGQRALGPWGEGIIKQFVREAVDEALKLEAALARLRTTHMVALLHYSPVQATVEGEPFEIYPFLGSSRLEEPINRYPVSLVLHGHAHRGQLEGRTKSGVSVCNVAMPLLSRTFADRPPFRVFEVQAGERQTCETPPAHSVPSATPPVREPVAAGGAISRGRRAGDAVPS
jgi:Icc-related predicted phosphoesterase